MALKSFKKIQSPDRIINQIQDSVATALKPLLDNPILDGRLIEGITIATGTPTPVEHGLGRNIRGWIVTDRDAGATVWRTDSPLPTKTMILNASANLTLSIWVF